MVLQDPNAADDAALVIDRVRFEDAWSGDVILVKRNYEISDENQPFSIGLVTALIFRERSVVRDIAICAVVLSLLALTPIIFWRLLSDKVIYFKAYNTFFVVCFSMAVLVIFEAIFAYVRQFLVVHLTTRLDVKLATYMFDKVLNLPIDFFERTQTGTITHDMQEMWKIRTFLMGQLFGTVLDSTTLLVFLPVMFFFSPVMTLIVLAACGLMAAWIIAMLPVYRRKSMAVEAAEISARRSPRANDPWHSYGQIARARCTTAAPLGRVDRSRGEITFCSRDDRKLYPSLREAARAIRRQRFLCRGRLSRAVDQRSGLYRSAVCIPDVVAAGIWAFIANGPAHQPVRRCAHCGRRCCQFGQPTGRRGALRPRGARPNRWPRSIFERYLQICRGAGSGLAGRFVRGSEGNNLRDHRAVAAREKPPSRDCCNGFIPTTKAWSRSMASTCANMMSIICAAVLA